jgi:hypothetical protein
MEEEKIQPDAAAKMNFPFDVPGIRAEMARMLSIPKCSSFVKKLLAEVSSKAPPLNTLVENGDILKVFDMVMSQKGLVRAGDTAHGADKSGANLALGNIAKGNAQIQVGTYRPGLPVTAAELKAQYLISDARICLHETIHHAGKLVYSDEDLAIQCSLMNNNTPALPTPMPDKDMRFVYSQYWDKELRKTYK